MAYAFAYSSPDPNDGRFDNLDEIETSQETSGENAEKSVQQHQNYDELTGVVGKNELTEKDNYAAQNADVTGSDIKDIKQLFGVRLKPTKKDVQTEKTDFKSFLFGPRKKTAHPHSQPKIKYQQPDKVSTVDPDPNASYPNNFVLKLRSGKSRHQRGYHESVKPLPHDTPKKENHTRFVCVSDTHNEHDNINIPDGDVLLHCGDFTLAGKMHEITDFNRWLGEIPFERKIVIAGNHELSFDPKIMEGVKTAKEKKGYSRWGSYLEPILDKGYKSISSHLTNCTYLEDSGETINGIRIWGSPWQPEFGGWGFNVPRGREILKKWDLIPGNGIDILMTHGPPAGHGDKVQSGMSVGCVDLLNSVQLRVQPKYHLFGHIHEDYGITTDNFTTYINCSSVNYQYQPVHKAIIFDLPNKVL